MLLREIQASCLARRGTAHCPAQIRLSLHSEDEAKEFASNQQFLFFSVSSVKVFWVLSKRVKKGEGTQKFFIRTKSLFSQKAIVKIKNPSFHWICLFFWVHKPWSESRKNFSMVVATYIRTVKYYWICLIQIAKSK